GTAASGSTRPRSGRTGTGYAARSWAGWSGTAALPRSAANRGAARRYACACRPGKGENDMDEQSRLRVFLVDDHAMFRAGVRAELGAYVDVVGEASTVGQAVTAIAAVQPDVVLLDVHMPDGGGRAVREPARKSHQQVRC